MRFPGVIPAITCPFDARGEVDLDALAGNARSLLDAGLTGLVGNGTMGESGSLSEAERRSVVEALVDAAGDRAIVTAGVSAQTPEVAILHAREAVAAGAGALMLLPPLLYGGDEREILAFYASVAAATELPIMAYNNPVASGGTDLLPGFLIRLGQEVDAVVAVKECSGDARRIAALVESDLEVLVGGDDWALEGFAAGATGWVSGVANVAPEACVALQRHVADGELDAARELNARLLPLGRLDMTPKLVQYFKAAQDAVGRVGGPCRPPRLELTTEERALLDAALGALARPGGRRLRAARVFAAVDSHTEGMPTRVVTGGVGPLPGATMLERKAHFEAELDDLRRLLMREPRGHGAMSGAILQPPTREDADWGVLFIEVSGCLPMCGHGTIGVATVLVETGMVAVTEPETIDPARHAGRARRGPRGGAARARRPRSRCATSPRSSSAATRSSSCPRARSSTTSRSAATSTRSSTRRPHGLEVDPEHAPRADRGGRAGDGGDRGPGPPVHPADERIAGLRHVIFSAPGRDGADARAAVSIHPGWLDRSPCGTGTSARMAQLHARGELALDTDFVHESVIGTRFTGRLVAETEVGGRPAVIPEITGRAWITGMGQYLLDPTDPFPAGFSL